MLNTLSIQNNVRAILAATAKKIEKEISRGYSEDYTRFDHQTGVEEVARSVNSNVDMFALAGVIYDLTLVILAKSQEDDVADDDDSQEFSKITEIDCYDDWTEVSSTDPEDVQVPSWLEIPFWQNTADMDTDGI